MAWLQGLTSLFEGNDFYWHEFIGGYPATVFLDSKTCTSACRSFSVVNTVANPPRIYRSDDCLSTDSQSLTMSLIITVSCGDIGTDVNIPCLLAPVQHHPIFIFSLEREVSATRADHPLFSALASRDL
ncbi:uncharacterized protein PADG_11090 [Paracoccidioides brasiliensis Pb18]|uniref:Uncharacterized protein n=1 Tax=Paracoccidioides brasiliensis (strain Pb18) TaxID=502780 RepID=A0A0A0HW67_PARBD|nr:uncharacterized protein PADG_11090 [Paracoccidioides brasiliensis Pb18]KGM92638.1 hypothetical protein PADG_11090 [Paracoccidioides brasiliensis Pb18]